MKVKWLEDVLPGIDRHYEPSRAELRKAGAVVKKGVKIDIDFEDIASGLIEELGQVIVSRMVKREWEIARDLLEIEPGVQDGRMTFNVFLDAVPHPEGDCGALGTIDLVEMIEATNWADYDGEAPDAMRALAQILVAKADALEDECEKA